MCFSNSGPLTLLLCSPMISSRRTTLLRQRRLADRRERDRRDRREGDRGGSIGDQATGASLALPHHPFSLRGILHSNCAPYLKSQGIKAIAIVSVYAPIDFTHQHETRVRKILLSVLSPPLHPEPDIGIVCSKDISNLSLLERENATIMNASLLRFAKYTTASFERAAKELGLSGCPVFVTSNDGTLLSCAEAGETPIRTL